MKILELTMHFFNFSDEGPIPIFDFLSILLEGANVLDVDKRQLKFCLPHMLSKNAPLE